MRADPPTSATKRTMSGALAGRKRKKSFETSSKPPLIEKHRNARLKQRAVVNGADHRGLAAQKTTRCCLHSLKRSARKSGAPFRGKILVACRSGVRMTGTIATARRLQIPDDRTETGK